MAQPYLRTTAEAPSARPDRPATTPGHLRHWDLVELAAEGTLTQIYRARPEGSGSDLAPAYALKVLRPEWENDPRAVGLLRREALVGRQVACSHLIPVLAAGLSSVPYYVVTPWLEGETLAHRLRSGVVPPVAFWIARQVATALQSLDAAGWTHGDIKPGNIFVSPQAHVTLLDLGFARRINPPEKEIQRCVAGTCHYISPEMIAGLPRIDIRSDIYSLGVLLFQMLARRLPFEGDSPAELARQHREVRPPELADPVPGLPDDAYGLVRQMLAKEPLRRPPTPELITRLAAMEIATFAWGRARPAEASS